MTATKPTISYGHGYLTDGQGADIVNWTKTENGQTLALLVSLYDDYFDIECTNSTGSKDGYYRNNTDLSLSSTVYTECRYRYKVSGASVAKIVLEFSSGEQAILASGTSTTWVSAAVTITSGKTINRIRIHNMNGVGHVYVDFILIYKGDFPIPNSAYGAVVTPEARIAYLEPPGALGSNSQLLGNKSSEATLDCDLDIGTWKRAGDVADGEVFFDIVHNSASEPWQWLNTGDFLVQFKSVLDVPKFQHATRGKEVEHILGLTLHEHRRAPANAFPETYAERFGLTT
jgi:hypothetical protein